MKFGIKLLALGGFMLLIQNSLSQQPVAGDPNDISFDQPAGLVQKKNQQIQPVVLNAKPIYDFRKSPQMSQKQNQLKQLNQDQNQFLRRHDSIKTSIGVISIAHGEDQIPQGWRVANEKQIKQVAFPAIQLVKKAQNEDTHQNERKEKPEDGKQEKYDNPKIIVKELSQGINIVQGVVQTTIEMINQELKKLKEAFKIKK